MNIESSVVFVTGRNRGQGLARDFDVPKTTPAEVARRTLDGLAAGKDEVLANEGTRLLKQGLSREPPSYIHPQPR